MVWPSKVISLNAKVASIKKYAKGKSADRATLKKEEEPTNEKSYEQTLKSKSESIHWPSVVLDDTRKHKTHTQYQKSPSNEGNDVVAKLSGTAWPSNVVFQQQQSGTTVKTIPMNRVLPESDLWPSMVLHDKMQNKSNGAISEERNERSTFMRGQEEEREGIRCDEYSASNHHLEHLSQVRSPNTDQLSFATSSSSEEDEDDDDTTSCGSDTYDSKSYGTSTLETRSFDTRNLELGCFVDQGKVKYSTFHPTIPPREAESDNMVAALVQLTTNCYAPTGGPDMPF